MDFITHMNSLRNYRADEVKAIADITESSTSAVYMWMAGRANVPKLKRKIIAKYLGKTEAELWPEDEKEM